MYGLVKHVKRAKKAASSAAKMAGLADPRGVRTAPRKGGATEPLDGISPRRRVGAPGATGPMRKVGGKPGGIVPDAAGTRLDPNLTPTRRKRPGKG